MPILKQILWLAICIYHEARGESAKGQIAVGHVIMNRVGSRDKSVEKIVLQPYQFSWANNNKRPYELGTIRRKPERRGTKEGRNQREAS